MLLRLQLISTGQFFVMDNSNGITIDINSTVFQDQNDFLGSMSYAGKIPLEDNRALIQNAHFITTSAKLRTLDVMIWLGNIPWKVAKFNFLIEDTVIGYQLLIDHSVIAKDMATRKLNGRLDLTPVLFNFFSGSTSLTEYMLDTAKVVPGAYPMVFFPVKNEGAYKTIDPDRYTDYPNISFPVNSYMNGWQVIDGIGSFSDNVDGTKQKETQLPFFYLVYVLRQIIILYGYTPVGSWLEDTDAKRICIYTQVPIEGFIILDYQYYMPDITVADFLKVVRSEFGLLIDFDETAKICVVESLKYLEDTSDTVDLTQKQLESYRELDYIIDGYTITQSPDDNDAVFSDVDKANIPTIVIGNGLNEVDLTSVATKMINEDAFHPDTSSLSVWRVPYMSQPVSGAGALTEISNIEYKDRNSFKLRFFYYHGMVNDSEGHPYPYGSTDKVNIASIQVNPTGLPLPPPWNAPGTPNQLLPHKYTLLTNSKPFEMGFNLTKEEFLSMRVNKRVVVRDKNQASVSCILSSFTTDIADSQTVNSKLTLYPVIRVNNSPIVITNISDVPGPPVDNGIVYVKIEERNLQRVDVSTPPTSYVAYQVDVYAVFYSDVGTTSKSVDRLPVRFNAERRDSWGNSNSQDTITCTGTEFLLQASAPLSKNGSGGFVYWTYTLVGSAYYNIIT